MTTQEHQLMIGMFARQLKINRTLVEILKTNGIIQDGDVSAFYNTLSSLSGLISDDWITQADKMYREVASPLGINLPKTV